MKGTIIFDLEGTLVDVGGQSVSKVFIEEKQLEEITKEYELAIVTGATRQELSYVLTHTFLGKYFCDKNTVTKDDCSEPKATGRPFQKLLERGLTKPMVIIGDSEGDKFGAQVSNIPFFQVKTSHLLSGGNFDEYIKSALYKLDTK